jgi:glycine cleavage system H protein
MKIPENVQYTKDHEWIRLEGDFGWVGITDYAQGELGDIVFVELPTVGTKVFKGKSFGTIEAVKAVSDLYAPAAGEVVELNKAIQDSPEVINKDPYGEGWMVKLKIADKKELSSLLDAAAYSKLTGK